MRVRLPELALGVLLVGLFALTLLFEYVAAVTLYTEALALAAALGGGCGALFFLASRRRFVLTMTAVYLAGLLTLRFIEISPVKPFRVFYESVEPGMSRVEALGELARRFPEDGRYTRPEAFQYDTGISWALDPTDGAYDSEFVQIKLAGDLVTGKRYLPD